MNKTAKSRGHVETRQRGRINAHFNPKRGTYRLRLGSLHEDQVETILLALKKSRSEAGTDYDAVALELICLSYLAT